MFITLKVTVFNYRVATPYWIQLLGSRLVVWFMFSLKMRKHVGLVVASFNLNRDCPTELLMLLCDLRGLDGRL